MTSTTRLKAEFRAPAPDRPRRSVLSDYSEDERRLPRSTRIQLLEQLFRLRLPIARDESVVAQVQMLLREGAARSQRASFTEAERAKRLYRVGGDNASVPDAAPMCAALIGPPSTGKSSSVRTATAHLRRVAYDSELDVFRIRALRIEISFNETDLASLARRIIYAVDQAIPTAGYYSLYIKGKLNVHRDVLLADAFRLLQIHRVELLVMDERPLRSVVGPTSADSDEPPGVTRLIYEANRLGIAVHLTGGADLRQLLKRGVVIASRPASSSVMEWHALSPAREAGTHARQPSEFDAFLRGLWRYQWTLAPIELTRRVRNIFFHSSAGLPGQAVKLFHSVQLRAIRTGGSEMVDEDLVYKVANAEFLQLHHEAR